MNTLITLGFFGSAMWANISEHLTVQQPRPDHRPDHSTGNFMPYSFAISVWVLLRPLQTILTLSGRSRTHDLPRDNPMPNQLSHRCTMSTFRSMIRFEWSVFIVSFLRFVCISMRLFPSSEIQFRPWISLSFLWKRSCETGNELDGRLQLIVYACAWAADTKWLSGPK